ncbi:hypothetical protein [Paracoccus aeridis]|uniref:hypothetical protein n=1 Tax=Paracoccus aeridis TaxID=1966466 RepID=UPI001F1E7F40|nr:hypothetical protein [Paracoccus aeridis]
MKIMDRLSRILGSPDPAASEPDSHVLGPFEIRLIAEGKLERLAEFAASSRLLAADPKGDTPLHLAARMGNLAVCDLFIRSGADPSALNHGRQKPADVAFAEGHGLAAQLLSSLVAESSETEMETVGEREFSLVVGDVVTGPDRVPERRVAVFQEIDPTDRTDDLDDLLTFEAEAEPEEFFDQHAGDTASGTFVALISSSPVISDSEDGDWDLDLSAAPIAGEAIASSAAVTADHGAENDFLKVRNRGRQSVKRAVVQSGTRMSIDPELCVTWAEEILAKGQCSLDDIDRLVAHCEGNGDLEELRINLQRNLEAAGFDLAQATGHDADIWDAVSDTSSEDLAGAIEAALTRRTRLPGTQRFVMDKSEELQLLEPMMRAKQEL